MDALAFDIVSGTAVLVKDPDEDPQTPAALPKAK